MGYVYLMKESSGSFFHAVYERNSVLTLEPTTAWNEKMKALTFETLQNDFKKHTSIFFVILSLKTDGLHI